MTRLPLLLTLLGLSGVLQADAMGVVNFTSCITDSKLGKQEQAAFENLKNQMTALLQDTEKQLHEIAAKFNDSEFLDGLSPEAEEELKNKYRSLSEDLNRYQNQYYQVLNQANMKLVQNIAVSTGAASERVAQEKHLRTVLNKEALFFYAPELDVTALVIEEMDKAFDQESKHAQPEPLAK
jgi:outer membrane protein